LGKGKGKGKGMGKGLIFFIFVVFNLAALETDPKEWIRVEADRLKSASLDQKGEIGKELAKAYFKDQELGKAFRVFLEALETVPAHPEPPMSDEERALYEKALDAYHHPKGGDSHEAAPKLRDQLLPIVKQHPEYYRLKFLTAIAYANLNQFEPFFDLFFSAYSQAPEHYLAYKTKAILHIKLFEREPIDSEREVQRLAMMKNLNKAIQIYPQDISLYKIQITFAPEAEKEAIVTRNLKKIIDGNMMTPRADVGFFVVQAIKVKQNDLAREFLDKAKIWYPLSRTITAAEEYLKAGK
jgi:tetratricopeptide (TPR) repeat protein